ncbi:Lacal_2735 family protein [Polaribacter haliotis]|uniref:Lacal_2735 family protein n=1 Tax=Polaribacter haliotis TaxID=1888915 RepID=A0A7L8AJP0_9FLAO|nr:Lacal_2735 family protein [Polaribacter haliotis]QOD62019.1 Lacal_2735 family protein [Polaribacter haliotis]
MFGLFKKKSAVEKLQEKYKKLMEEGFKLQSINRSDSDQKYLEADNLLKEIEKLKENS